MTTYITTPIYYVNAQPHLGHAYTTVVADTYSRFRRLIEGADGSVRFQTGTDEHGEKIVEAAEKDGVTPKEYVDSVSTMFQQTWPLLEIVPDHTIRTTDAEHIAVVQKILQDVYDKGDIYFDRYTGLYCRGCERYLTEKELVDGCCPDHQKPPEEIAEENYFFRMSKYQQALIDHIKANPDFITPKRYKNEVLSFLSESLEDLCISRPKSRLTWGIELPFDDNFVTYVWFDALINYLSGLGYPDGEKMALWQGAEHLIAKDILKPHAIYWPTMLLSIGVPLYQRLHVHGYWNVDDTKMSKSLGNVVRPKELAEEYGVDTLRYFLLRDMSFGLDSSFNSELIAARHNSDLANDLGNLFNRSLTLVHKFADGMVPTPNNFEESEKELQKAAETMLEKYRDNMATFRFHIALQSVWEFVSLANRYIVVNEPWQLGKDPTQKKRLDTVLYAMLENLRLLAFVLQPIMPKVTREMIVQLGGTREQYALFETNAVWGKLDSGRKMATPEMLFPRLESLQKDAEKPANKQQKKQGKEKKSQKGTHDEYVRFEDFQKIDLRVAKIVNAEPIKGSDRLYKLTVEAPEQRTIVAGIAEHYHTEELLGKEVIIVANLKPAKLMGVRSEGMVLAAKEIDEGGNTQTARLVLSGVDKSIAPGSRVA